METSKREDGSMSQKENIEKFCRKLGIDSNNLVIGKQVHGKKVEIINKKSIFNETDGLITESPEFILGVLTADCLPISFRSNRICGILHVGWRGLFKGIIEEAVEKVKFLREDISNLSFKIGPGIGICHFEVKKDLIKEFEKITNVGNFEDYCNRRNDKYFLDIKKIAKKKIENYNIKSIEVSSHCTYCNNNYFSYRRDRKLNQLISIIKL